jgi:hypothetical protein
MPQIEASLADNSRGVIYTRNRFKAQATDAINGWYYKHVTIVNDDSSVISKWSLKLTDNSRGVIYTRNRFIAQATDAIIGLYYVTMWRS